MKVIKFPSNKIKNPWKTRLANHDRHLIIDLFVASCVLVATIAIVWYIVKHLNT